MTLGLRVVRQSHWYREAWLTRKPDIPSTALLDVLDEKSTAISIWIIEKDLSNFERVVAALAANRDRVSNFDYALFDMRVLRFLRIQSKPEAGNTPDAIVNQKYHANLTEMTAAKTFCLAQAMHRYGEPVRIGQKVIAQYIRNAIASNTLDRQKIRVQIA